MLDKARLRQAVEARAGHLPPRWQEVVALSVEAAATPAPDLRQLPASQRVVDYLRERPGKVIAPAALVEALGLASNQVLRVHIYNARRAVPELRDQLKMIYGRGYTWKP